VTLETRTGGPVHAAVRSERLLRRPGDAISRLAIGAHRVDAIKRECAFFARFRAGVRAGGFRSNPTTRRWSSIDKRTTWASSMALWAAS